MSSLPSKYVTLTSLTSKIPGLLKKDINFENENEVLIFVTKEQLENSLDWYCYMDIAIDLLMQETDGDYKMIKSKTCRTTLVFDNETLI